MPTVQSGVNLTGGTGAAINSDRVVVDILKDIYTYDPTSTPMLTYLTSNGRVRPARATTVKHLEDEPVPEWLTEDGSSLNTTATSLVVESGEGTYCRVGDILFNPASGETMEVTAISTDTLTIVRSFGTTAAASIAAAQKLVNLGKPELEGGDAPAALHTVTVTKENYTQILKESVHLSRTLDQIDLYGSPQRDHLRKKAGAKHAREWEQICLWGEKVNDVSGAAPKRAAGGLNEHISTNELDVSSTGIMSENQLRDFIGDCSRFKVDGSDGRKALIASRAVIDTIESWGANKLQTAPGGNKYGFGIRTWYSSYGEVDVVWHPLIETGAEGYAFVIDTGGMLVRPLQPTKLMTNIQDVDEDAYRDQYLTEQTFSFMQEKAFGRIKGVTFS